MVEQSEKIRSESDVYVKDLVADARKSADRIVADAREFAEQTIAATTACAAWASRRATR